MAKDLGTLTNPGITDVIAVSHFDIKMFTVILSSVGIDVTIRIEGSYDRVNWENLDRDNLVLDSNDTYNIIITEERPVDFLRLNWVSQSGAGAEMRVLFRGKN